jgi:hypothetical protein
MLKAGACELLFARPIPVKIQAIQGSKKILSVQGMNMGAGPGKTLDRLPDAAIP